MRRSTLHIFPPQISYDISSTSVCRYSAYAARFAEMMRAHDWECVVYYNGSHDIDGVECVKLIDDKALSGLSDVQDVRLLSSVRLMEEMERRMVTGDVLCHFFGSECSEILPLAKSRSGINVEPAVFYRKSFSRYRIYQSYAWAHVSMEREGASFSNAQYVIPPFYDEKIGGAHKNDGYVMWSGGTSTMDGLDILKACAMSLPNMMFYMFEDGRNSSRFPGIPEVNNVDVVYYSKMSEYFSALKSAGCFLCPRLYVEPSANLCIEALLYGVPCVTTDFGAFSEVIAQGKSGYRCKTVGDFVHGIVSATSLGDEERARICDDSRKAYSCEVAGKLFSDALDQISMMEDSRSGWSDLSNFCYISRFV